MLLHREKEDKGRVVFKTWASWMISGCLNAEFGGVTAQLGILSPMRYRICWQGKMTVLYWGLYHMGGKQ